MDEKTAKEKLEIIKSINYKLSNLGEPNLPPIILQELKKIWEGKFKNCACTEQKIKIINYICQVFKPKRTIEIGFGPGASTLVFLNQHQSLKSPDKSHIAIDPYIDRFYDRSGIESATDVGLVHLLEVIKEPSFIALPKLLSDKFEMAFIDGGHRFEEFMIDWFYLKEMIPVGGVMIVDDIFYPSVKAAVSYITRNHSYEMVKFGPDICVLVKMEDKVEFWADYHEFNASRSEKELEFINKTRKKMG